MNAARIRRCDSDGLCTLTLSRPEKLNALDTQTFLELDAHLAQLEHQTDSIGCIVLQGEGRAFCAGADLTALGVDADGSPVDPAFKPGVIDRLAALPQPVIAAVHGVCFAGGLELALACDFIVADASARFADTHGKWGLVAAWGLYQRLPRRIGTPRAQDLMMTGGKSMPHRALRWALWTGWLTRTARSMRQAPWHPPSLPIHGTSISWPSAASEKPMGCHLPMPCVMTAKPIRARHRIMRNGSHVLADAETADATGACLGGDARLPRPYESRTRAPAPGSKLRKLLFRTSMDVRAYSRIGASPTFSKARERPAPDRPATGAGVARALRAQRSWHGAGRGRSTSQERKR